MSAGCPDDSAHDCGDDDDGRDAIGYQPRTTVLLPPPDAVVAARLLRAERAAHMHRIDRLDEALGVLLAGMTAAQRAEVGD